MEKRKNILRRNASQMLGESNMVCIDLGSDLYGLDGESKFWWQFELNCRQLRNYCHQYWGNENLCIENIDDYSQEEIV